GGGAARRRAAHPRRQGAPAGPAPPAAGRRRVRVLVGAGPPDAAGHPPADPAAGAGRAPRQRAGEAPVRGRAGDGVVRRVPPAAGVLREDPGPLAGDERLGGVRHLRQPPAQGPPSPTPQDRVLKQPLSREPAASAAADALAAGSRLNDRGTPRPRAKASRTTPAPRGADCAPGTAGSSPPSASCPA